MGEPVDVAKDMESKTPFLKDQTGSSTFKGKRDVLVTAALTRRELRVVERTENRGNTILRVG